jgi:AcrR family transcriptional regulator
MSNTRRTPQQERGERRVAQLLEAASEVMAEVGYQSATMTAIAERAGASIGTLYQYYPDKDAVVDALRLQYVKELEVHWATLKADDEKLSLKRLVDRLVDMIVMYIDRRPAYLPLMTAPRDKTRNMTIRNRLREHLAGLFSERQPALTHEEAYRIANLTMQVLKGLNPLFEGVTPKEKEIIIGEFKILLFGYLSARLKFVP